MYTLQYTESKTTIQIHAVSYLKICNHGSPYTHTLAYKQNKQKNGNFTPWNDGRRSGGKRHKNIISELANSKKLNKQSYFQKVFNLFYTGHNSNKTIQIYDVTQLSKNHKVNRMHIFQHMAVYKNTVIIHQFH
jgi:hypothetical protein